MALKRNRDGDDYAVRSLSKRPKVNPDLVRVWERLADDSEETRFEAAYDLISTHFASADLETAQKLLGRLFRGLCSSRKSARPGFYTALVGILSRAHQNAFPLDLPLSKVLVILETQTTAEAETSKQDERDHRFGRLLGIKAVVESGLLSQASDDQWNALLDALFGLMVTKPWLRVQGSEIVRSCILSVTQDKQRSDQRLLQLLKQLKKHKLVRTGDGVSVWLMIMEILPKPRLPQDSWKSGNPLSPSELLSLKRALLDTRQSHNDDEDNEITGRSVWSPRLSLAWEYILKRLGQTQKKEDVSFEDFWNEVVENGMFSPASTPERKILGFLVLQDALKYVQPSHFRTCFSKNLMVTVTQALRNQDEAYLKRSIDTTFKAIKTHFQLHRESNTDDLIKAFIIGSGFIDFDTSTKSRFVQSLFESIDLRSEHGIGRDLLAWLTHLPDVIHGISQNTARRNILTILQRAIEAKVHSIKTNSDRSETAEREALSEIARFVSKLITMRQHKDDTQLDDEMIALFDEKSMSILEGLITVGPSGVATFFDVVRDLKKLELEAEEGIEDAIQSSWKHFSSFRKRAQKHEVSIKHEKPEKQSPETAFAALMGLNLLEVYSGDTDAAEMMEELNAIATDFTNGKAEQVADSMIDIVMSFLSKPSKLNRRIGNLAFSGFAPQISSEGLKILTDVITTKETREGQQALFEQDGNLAEETNSFNEDDLDSDVEVLEASASDAEDSANDQSDDDDDTSSQSSSDSASNDEELNSFESALAAALGTRKFTEADLNDAASESGLSSSDGDSDSDMSDSEMMQLDDKLAEVFRNQANQTSAQKQRREEIKNVRENAVNLKNRALDLIEIFLRTQQSRGMECAALLAALMEMAKETGTPQLATKGLDMVKSYVQKCKGAKLPFVPDEKDVRDVLESKLAQLYEMVYAKDVSNAFIDVAAQVNILFCKLLSRAGVENIPAVIERISEKYGKRSDLRRKAVQDFWLRFDAWAANHKQKAIMAHEPASLRDGSLTMTGRQGMGKTSGKQRKTKK